MEIFVNEGLVRFARLLELANNLERIDSIRLCVGNELEIQVDCPEFENIETIYFGWDDHKFYTGYVNREGEFEFTTYEETLESLKNLV